MNNKVKINQYHKMNKAALEAVGENKERYIQHQRNQFDIEIGEFVANHFPLSVEDTQDLLVFKRELFIFTKEQLEEFIKDITKNKTYIHEV